jgi:hypothetical protein
MTTIRKSSMVAVAVLTLLAEAATGQVASTENPFPETGKVTDSVVFGTSRPISLSGIITEEIARPDHPLSPYLFFRIGVRGQDGTVANWTIRI